MTVVVSRISRRCFIKSYQVVFAVEKNIADAFVKTQTILEFICNSIVVIVLFFAGVILCIPILYGRDQGNKAIVLAIAGTILGLLAVAFLTVCYHKLKPLEKIYKDKVAVYME